jgi:DNA-binding transcriptional regulator YiaG
VAGVPSVPSDAIEAAIDEVMSRLVPHQADGGGHLARAVMGQRIAAVANHRSHTEVTAAREEDAMSWDDIGHAFGISPETARERFRSAPTGLPG